MREPAATREEYLDRVRQAYDALDLAIAERGAASELPAGSPDAHLWPAAVTADAQQTADILAFVGPVPADMTLTEDEAA